MKNREKIHKIADIDIIYSMAMNRFRYPIKGPCVLFLLDPYNCLPNNNCNKKEKCYDCIQKWLNMEVEL